MSSSRNKHGLAGVAAGLLALVAPISSADGITIPRGTAVDLILENVLSSRSARVGDPFHATLARALFVDGQLALPETTVVEGRVAAVAALREGARSAFIGVKFVRLSLPGGEPKRGISASLTSLRQHDRRNLVGLASEVGTGRCIDVVLVGRSNRMDERAHTLVRDDSPEAFARSGASETEVEVSAGTLVSMEFDEPLTVPRAAMGGSELSEARRIHVSSETVAAAQRELRERRRYWGEADGRFDTGTRHAIILFQLDHGQEATGDLDVETLRLLGLAPLALP